MSAEERLDDRRFAQTLRMTENEDILRRYPYEPPLEKLFFGDPYDLSLPLRDKDGEVHIPTIARKVLDELRYSGLLHRRDVEPPENIRKAKVGNRQEVWIRFDTYRDDEGFMAVDVVDAPRSDVAILAAMTAFLMEPVDPEQVAEAFRFNFSEDRAVQLETVKTTFKKREENPNDVTPEELVIAINTMLELAEKEKPLMPLTYILPLLSYYRPEVRNYPEPELRRYAEEAYHYINDFLRSLRNLQGFLEYGVPDRKLTPVVKQAKRDVRAAVLRDVDGLSYREIGGRLGVPLPPDFEVKGEHQTVRRMVNKGRRILEEAFGKDGWRERAEAMRADKAWWKSLNPVDKAKEIEIERTAWELGVSIEEARQQVGRSDP